MAYAPTTYDYFTMDPVARVMVSEDLSEIFSNTVLLESDIAGIYLYDTSLNQIAAMGKAADNPDFVQSLKKQMEFGDIFYLNQAGVPFYTVYFPVYDLNNRQYGIQTGMCVMMVRTDNLSGLLEDSQATENTQVFLLDGNNQDPSVQREQRPGRTGQKYDEEHGRILCKSAQCTHGRVESGQPHTGE